MSIKAAKHKVMQLLLLCFWILLLGGGGLTLKVYAHEGGFPFRYVSVELGVDSGDCDKPQTPCRTIQYALAHKLPGDQIRVAKGVYLLKPQTTFQLLNNDLIKGGYDHADEFTIQDLQLNPTYVLGPDMQQESLLAERGFILIRDAKEATFRSEATIQGQTVTNFSAPTGYTPCRGGFAGPYPCAGVDLLALMPLSQFSSNPSQANDIWGFVDKNDNNEYAIIGLNNGTAVVNVTDPLNPLEVDTISGLSTSWRDIKVYQLYNSLQDRWNAYAYVTADGVAQGLQIIDLSSLPVTVSLTATYTDFSKAHNISISHVDYTTGITRSGTTAYAYILGANLDGGAFRILDLSEPVAPLESAGPPVAAEYVHDATTFVITDSRATTDCAGHNPCEILIDYNLNTVDIWDVTAKTSPFQISSTPYMGASYAHSGWWSEDKQYVFIQDEFDESWYGHNTRLRVLDISDLKTPFISRIWTGPTRAIDHNGFVKRSHYYMSTYQRGLTILNITSPNNLAEITFFDTYPASDGPNYGGAWGTYPYLSSETILVSDISGGLFLLREQGVAISNSGPTLVEINAPITYTLMVTNNGTFPANNIVFSTSIPAETVYLTGGTKIGNVLSWHVASLAPGEFMQTIFVVSASTKTTVLNDDYVVSAVGSVTATAYIALKGDQIVTTSVGGEKTFLPIILKD